MHAKKINFILNALLVSCILFVAGTAFAQATNSACTGDPIGDLFCNTTDITATLNSLFQICISIGAVLAMLRIGYSGFLYMGRDDMWSNKQHAKDVFRDAIIGLLLLLAIWLILNQINPDILKLRLLQNAGPINTSDGTSPSQFTGGSNTVTAPSTPPGSSSGSGAFSDPNNSGLNLGSSGGGGGGGGGGGF